MSKQSRQEAIAALARVTHLIPKALRIVLEAEIKKIQAELGDKTDLISDRRGIPRGEGALPRCYQYVCHVKQGMEENEIPMDQLADLLGIKVRSLYQQIQIGGGRWQRRVGRDYMVITRTGQIATDGVVHKHIFKPDPGRY